MAKKKANKPRPPQVSTSVPQKVRRLLDDFERDTGMGESDAVCSAMILLWSSPAHIRQAALGVARNTQVDSWTDVPKELDAYAARLAAADETSSDAVIGKVGGKGKKQLPRPKSKAASTLGDLDDP